MDAETLSPSIEVRAQTTIPTKFGPFEFIVFHSLLESGEEHHLSSDHVALVRGDVRNRSDVLVRIHSECLTSEVFGSARFDCQEQLAGAQAEIERSGLGAIIYLRQEGRGIGLANKIQAYNLQHDGHDTVEANLLLGLPADARDYQPAAAILAYLGVSSIRLLTNNPQKTKAMLEYGIQVAGQVPLVIEPSTFSAHYLEVKRRRMGHLLPASIAQRSDFESARGASDERPGSPESQGESA